MSNTINPIQTAIVHVEQPNKKEHPAIEYSKKKAGFQQKISGYAQDIREIKSARTAKDVMKGLEVDAEGKVTGFASKGESFGAAERAIENTLRKVQFDKLVSRKAVVEYLKTAAK